MAKQEQVDSTFEITIGGLYFANISGVISTKPYEVALVMDADHVKAGPLSMFKNFVAPDIMHQRYPDYVGLYTHEVRKTVPKDPAKKLKDINIMVRGQLIEYAAEKELGIAEALYEDDGALRQAIMDCEADSETFGKAQEILRTRKAKPLALKAGLRALNKSKDDLGV